MEAGPELSTHAARMLAIVSIRSRPSQLTGAPKPPVQLAAVAPWLLQKLAGAPVEMLARLACAWLTALASPILLVDDVPMFCPVGLPNCASAHCAATVVSSLTVTVVAELRLLHGPSTAISAMAELAPEPASPPLAMI